MYAYNFYYRNLIMQNEIVKALLKKDEYEVKIYDYLTDYEQLAFPHLRMDESERQNLLKELARICNFIKIKTDIKIRIFTNEYGDITLKRTKKINFKFLYLRFTQIIF